MQGNIVSITVDGVEVVRDFDLPSVQHFEAVTSTGNRYVVERDSSQMWTTTWDVIEVSPGSIPSQKHIGKVSSPRSFLGPSKQYRFALDHGFLDSGIQNDLWNAVQSLTD